MLKNYACLLVFCQYLITLTKSSTLCDVELEIDKSNFATKTGYFSAFKDASYWQEYRSATSGCTPQKVWFFSRHGTRYPVMSDIDSFDNLPRISEEILYNHFQGRGCLTEEDVFEFKRWIPYFDARDKGELHPAGSDELFSMGEHWRDLFPEIFGNTFDATKVKVEFTVRNRTGQSAYHFLRGMYGDDAIGTIDLPKPYEPNFILRFYRACPLWLRDVYRNNKTTYKERNLFKQTKVFQNMIQDVSSRLGYSNFMNFEDLLIMYDECRYEAAWFPHRTSIWCKPFSHEDLQILAFYQDLKYYYEDSYGTPMNKEIACRAVSDIYTHLRSKVASSASLPNGVLYFSHDKALMKIQTLLGMFSSPKPLKHDSFSQRDRKFRASHAAPFASNLGFVLYKCGTSHKVALFFEGNPVPLTSVCPTILCDWESYEEYLRPIYEDCDLAKLCRLHDEL